MGDRAAVVMHEALRVPQYDGLLVQPKVIVLRDDWFRQDEPTEYYWTHRETPDGEEVLVRLRMAAGFEFDGASIPGIATPIIGGRWALGIYPPKAHDGLYRCGGDPSRAVFGLHPDETDKAKARAGERYMWHEVREDGEWREVGHVWSRSEADRLFGRHMREAGVARWRRRPAYIAVRLGGRWSWREQHGMAA